MGNIITLEEMARFSRHAFHRHGQAVLADALVKLNKKGPKIEAANTAGRQYFKGQQNECLEEPPVGRNLEQLRQEFSLTYEQLESATKRSDHASYSYFKWTNRIERSPPFSMSNNPRQNIFGDIMELVKPHETYI